VEWYFEEVVNFECRGEQGYLLAKDYTCTTKNLVMVIFG